MAIVCSQLINIRIKMKQTKNKTKISNKQILEKKTLNKRNNEITDHDRLIII